MTESHDPHDDEIDDARQLTAAVHQLVESTEKQHEIKRAEIEVQSKEIESNEKIALASIQAQREYHSQRFTRYNDHLIHRYFFIGSMTVLVLGFSLGAIWLDAKDLVSDLFKMIVPLVVGLAGGYHWGARNTMKRAREEPPEED